MEKYIKLFQFASLNFITNHLTDAIKFNYDDKLIKFKAAKCIGYDFNTDHFAKSLLIYAVRKDDLLIAGYLAVNGGDIYVDLDGGKNIVYECAVDGKIHLLKYFLSLDKKNILMNKKFKETSPLLISFIFKRYDCAKILIDNGATFEGTIDKNNKWDSNLPEDYDHIANLVENILDLDRSKDNYKKIIELITLYFIKNKYTTNDHKWLKLIVYNEEDDLLLALLNNSSVKFDKIIYHKLPILFHSIELHMVKSINYIIFNTYNFNAKCLTKVNILYIFLNIGLYDICEHIINTDVNLLKTLDIEKRNAIDNAISANICYRWDAKSEDTIIKLLKLIADVNYKHSLGIDINNINVYGINPIKLAIQYGLTRVVKLLINNGCDISSDNKLLDDNDVLCKAVVFGKIEIIKILVNSMCIINIAENKITPTVLDIALRYNEFEIFKYLMSHERFSKYNNCKQNLLNIVNELKIVDRNIFKLLASDEYIKNIEFSDNDHYENIIKYCYRLFLRYDIPRKYTKFLFVVVYECINAINAIADNNVFSCDMIDAMQDKLYLNLLELRRVSSDTIVQIIMLLTNFTNVHLLNKLFEDMLDIDNDVNKKIFTKYSNITKLSVNKNKINDIVVAIRLYLNGEIDIKKEFVIKDYIDNPIKIIEHDDYKKQIYKLLSRLNFPVKVSHYNTLYKLLEESYNIPYEKTNLGYRIIQQKVEYFVFKSVKDNKNNLEFTESPTIWINYYNKNIASPHKQDKNHMFPFKFDKILNECPCYREKLYDKHSGKYGYKYSFDGYVKYDKKIKIRGIYEFCVTYAGILFHRLFLPLN